MTGPFSSIVHVELGSLALLKAVAHIVPPASGRHVTLPGRAAVGSGPVNTNPRLGSDEDATTFVEPMVTVSTKLKLAFLMVKVAAPVVTVIVGPLSLARSAPPKLPLPSVRVTVAVERAAN